MSDQTTSIRAGLILTAAILGFPVAAATQSFSGTDAAATPPFVLLSGDRSVAVTASAPASFRAFLLAHDGSVVATLSGADRQEIRVAEDGRYLLDVRASGSWTIRIDEPDPVRVQRARGRIDGAEAALGSEASAAWLGRGLVGGLLLGPIGTTIAVRRAGRAEPPLPATVVDRLALEDNDYGEAFRESYAEQWRGSQRAAALVGGITGTTILAFVILQVTVWGEEPHAEGEFPGNGETTTRFPITWFRITP